MGEIIYKREEERCGGEGKWGMWGDRGEERSLSNN